MDLRANNRTRAIANHTRVNNRTVRETRHQGPVIPKDCKRLVEVDFPIAEAFHGTGAVEVWGRGADPIIEMCQKYGAARPTFEGRQGLLIAKSKAQMVADGAAQRPGAQSTTQMPTQSTDPVDRLLTCLAHGAMSAGGLRSALRIKRRPTFRANYLHPALAAGWIEYTLPDKPNSRLQKYRLTPKGEKALKGRGGKSKK